MYSILPSIMLWHHHYFAYDGMFHDRIPQTDFSVIVFSSFCNSPKTSFLHTTCLGMLTNFPYHDQSAALNLFLFLLGYLCFLVEDVRFSFHVILIHGLRYGFNPPLLWFFATTCFMVSSECIPTVKALLLCGYL